MTRWRYYEQAYADLSGRPPEQRLPELVAEFITEAESISGEDLRRLFIYAWPDGAAGADQDENVLNMLRWISPVRDGGPYLAGALTIYRGAPEANDIRWTLDEERALAAAAAVGSAGIFRANVESGNVLAHLTGGGENEILVDPQDLTDIEVVGQSP